MTRALLGLGSNLGERLDYLRDAICRLDTSSETTEVTAVSSLYGSAALVPPGEPPGPDFLNAACEVETELAPQQLRGFVKDIEARLGRTPAPRWAARVIDIDILLYDDAVVSDDDLVVPHPAMLERHFVMVPLAEIAPDAVHPLLGKTIGELAEDVDVAGLEYVEGPEWADGVWERTP